MYVILIYLVCGHSMIGVKPIPAYVYASIWEITDFVVGDSHVLRKHCAYTNHILIFACNMVDIIIGNGVIAALPIRIGICTRLLILGLIVPFSACHAHSNTSTGIFSENIMIYKCILGIFISHNSPTAGKRKFTVYKADILCVSKLYH